VIIPPMSLHPEMEVGLMVGSERVYLSREDAAEVGEELLRQAGAKRRLKSA